MRRSGAQIVSAQRGLLKLLFHFVALFVFELLFFFVLDHSRHRQPQTRQPQLPLQQGPINRAFSTAIYRRTILEKYLKTKICKF